MPVAIRWAGASLCLGLLIVRFIMEIERVTVEFYEQLQKAFDHFNLRLFERSLPPCLITLRSSNRHYGYHHKDRFVSKQGTTMDELGLHPGFFTLRPVEEVLSTLVHEMVHHWQAAHGQTTKSNPHNREWAQKMRSLGLEPSSTGLPGGKDSGRSVSHYIVPDGLFIRSCRDLLDDGFELLWYDRYAPRASAAAIDRQEVLEQAGIVLEMSPVPAQSIVSVQAELPVVINRQPPRALDRVRYLCAGCGLKAWASADAMLQCGRCVEPMTTA